jgi:hypothetical protein
MNAMNDCDKLAVNLAIGMSAVRDRINRPKLQLGDLSIRLFSSCATQPIGVRLKEITLLVVADDKNEIRSQ